MSLTAGIAGVIFGIGCQNIVADILAGIIMAFEGEACVGDFVSFNDKLGTIQSIGVRTTKLKWFSEVTIVRNNKIQDLTRENIHDLFCMDASQVSECGSDPRLQEQRADYREPEFV